MWIKSICRCASKDGALCLGLAIATHGGAYTRVLDDAGMPWTLLPPVMDAERHARYLHDLVRIGKPGVRMLSADEVRQAVAAEVDFFRQVGARAAVMISTAIFLPPTSIPPARWGSSSSSSGTWTRRPSAR